MYIDNINYPAPKQEYKVLVRCATYNHSKYIEDALNGFAMQQTNFPFVCLVVDDASTDGEQEVIKAWMERECDMSRAETIDIPTSIVIIVPHKTNASCTFAFYLLKQNLHKNKTEKMRHVTPWREKCEYEALCEGDDYWISPLKIQKQSDFLDKNTAYTMCFHNAIERWEHDINKNNLFSKVRDRDYSGFYLLKNWIIPTASVMLRSSIYKTELYGKVLNCNDFLYGDTPMFVTCAEYGKIRGFSDIMSVYRRNEGGLTMMAKSYEHYCRLGIHIDTFHRVFGKSYYSPLFVSEIYLTSAFHLCQSRDFISAIKMLARNPYKIYYLISPISIIMKTLVRKIRKYYNGKFKY